MYVLFVTNPAVAAKSNKPLLSIKINPFCYCERNATKSNITTGNLQLEMRGSTSSSLLQNEQIPNYITKLALYGTDSQLLLTANFKVT